MISAGEFRKGITFEMNGEPHVILDFQHVKPGKGSPFVRTKYKNILTGATREEAFNPNDKFPKAHIETKKMQYLYNDGELYYFMDNDTFDQIPLHHDQVEEALKYVHSGMKLLDMCTGSGCILLSIVKLAAELNGCKEVTGTGVDLSEKALKIAQENRRTLGMEQTTALLQSDLFEQVNGTYDMIVSNPPYIASEVITTLSEEVKDHEPVMALDGGTDGLDFYRIIIEKSPAYLAPKGMLFFEIGYDQGVSVSRLMEKDFKDIHVIKDLAGLDRVVYGTLKA